MKLDIFRNLLFLQVFFIIGHSTPGFSGLLEDWNQTYPGGGAQTAGEAVADLSGNIVIAGQTSELGTIDFLTTKYRPDGTVAWTRIYDGPAGLSDAAHALAVDSVGGVYVAGVTLWQNPDGPNMDFATVRYDASGNKVYDVTFNGTMDLQDEAVDIAVDSTGNAYVTGNSGEDLVTIKYDPLGNLTWINRFPAATAVGVGLDPSGNVVVSGSANGDFLTIQYDGLNGNLNWTGSYDGLVAGGDDRVYAMKLDGLGNIFVTGESAGPSGTDFATVKYNSAGQEQWVNRVDFGLNDRPLDLDLDSEGNIYLTGYGDYFLGPLDLYFPSSSSAPVVKISPSGSLVWSNSFPSDSGGVKIAVDDRDNIFQAGYVITHYAPPYSKIQTHQFNASGNLFGEADFEPVRDGNFPAGIVPDNSGAVYVVDNHGQWGSPGVSLVKYSVIDEPVPPRVFSLNPSAGPVGTGVRIYGSGFGFIPGTSTVSFNGVEALASSWADSEIIAAVPEGATTGPVVVMVNGLSSNADQIFTVLVPDFIMTISPSSQTTSRKDCVVYRIMFESVAGFTSPIDLSAVQSPPGSSVRFLPSSTFLFGIDDMILMGVCPGKKMPTGTYTIVVEASGGGITHQGSVGLTITKGGGKK